MAPATGPKVKILIIEDDPGVSETLKDNLQEQHPELDVVIQGDFAEALSSTRTEQPDAVILDLLQGPPSSGVLAGNIPWKEIWEHRFVPLLVYTASAEETDPPLPNEHPFVKRIQKGQANSAQAVMAELTAFLPYLRCVAEQRDKLVLTMHRVLKETATAIWKSGLPMPERERVLGRALYRRVVAAADATMTAGSEKLQPMEQYVYPPVESDLLMGDVLRVSGAAWDDPTAYRVVLSPSCDLARRDQGQATGRVLIAECVSTGTLSAKWNLSATDEKAKKHLLGLLTQAQKDGLVPLPGLPGVLPTMALDLKLLHLMDYSTIEGFTPSGQLGNALEPAFRRIASVDSPFREFLGWAYLQVACRPGVPDREWLKWAEEIVATRQTGTAPINETPT